MESPHQPPPGESPAIGFDTFATSAPLASILPALNEHAIVAITDRAGRITYANDRFCLISGYPRHELLGQDHRLLNSGFHPHSYMRALWSTIGHGRTWHGHFCNRSKQGALYWVQSTVFPVLGADGKPDHYVSIRTDITAQKQAEAALAASDARFRRMFERSTDAMLLLDVEAGRFIEGNDAAARLLGFESSEVLVAIRPEELAPPRQMDGRPSTLKSAEMVALAVRRGSHRFPWICRSPKRAPFTVEVLLTRIDSDQAPLLLVTWREPGEPVHTHHHHEHTSP